MKPSAYWKQRFEALNQSLLNTSDQYCYEEVEKQYQNIFGERENYRCTKKHAMV